MSALSCYRYRTAALTGPWRRQPDTAIDDAVKAWQASLDEDGGVSWKVSGTIERSDCHADAPCRGVYPPE
jgi:hypothetical protein